VGAEAAVDHIDMGVPLRVFEEPLTRLLADAEIKVALVENAPVRVAGTSLTPVHLSDRASAAVDRDEQFGLPLEGLPCSAIREAVDPPVLLPADTLSARNQPMLLHQADGAKTPQSDFGLGRF
jgi:hypothetical protein